MRWKGKRSQKLIHLDTGIECHLSTRQEKQMVCSLLKKTEIWVRGIGRLEFCGFSKFSLEISHCLSEDADLKFKKKK